MILNIGDTKTQLLLGLAKTPLLFYPHYKYHLPLPTVLMIENTNHCNAECVMCPRDTLSRKRGFMDFGLFEKIIKEASSEKRKPVTHLHGFGEPLLDKLLPDRIQLAKNCGITRTYIVSNASLPVSRDIEEDHQRGTGQDEDQLLRHRRRIVQQHHEAGWISRLRCRTSRTSCGFGRK